MKLFRRIVSEYKTTKTKDIMMQTSVKKPTKKTSTKKKKSTTSQKRPSISNMKINNTVTYSSFNFVAPQKLYKQNKKDITRSPGGIYAIQQNASGNRFERYGALTKIGIARSFTNRFSSYLTVYPNGINMLALLAIDNASSFRKTQLNPETHAFDTSTKPTNESDTLLSIFLLHIEKEIHQVMLREKNVYECTSWGGHRRDCEFVSMRPAQILQVFFECLKTFGETRFDDRQKSRATKKHVLEFTSHLRLFVFHHSKMTQKDRKLLESFANDTDVYAETRNNFTVFRKRQASPWTLFRDQYKIEPTWLFDAANVTKFASIITDANTPFGNGVKRKNLKGGGKRLSFNEVMKKRVTPPTYKRDFVTERIGIYGKQHEPNYSDEEEEEEEEEEYEYEEEEEEE